MVTTRAARAGTGSWSPAELGVLLQAVEPLSGPAPPGGSVTVRGRDPVLAMCTQDDTLRDQVAAGVAAHGAVVTAGLRGLRADVHADSLEGSEDRRAWGRRVDSRSGRVQALVHLHP